MKIYDETKSKILDNPDLTKGYLKDDTIVVRIIPAQAEVQEQSHIEVVKEYPNGGKDVKTVIDVPYQPAMPEREETEDIKVYIPYTDEELLEREKQQLRAWREKYFNIIDCAVWYDCLTDEEKQEVKAFRYALLDITETMTKPTIPNCVVARDKEA